MKHRLNDLPNLLRRSVESATQNGLSEIDTCEGLEWGCEETFTTDAVTHIRGLDYARAASAYGPRREDDVDSQSIGQSALMGVH